MNLKLNSCVLLELDMYCYVCIVYGVTEIRLIFGQSETRARFTIILFVYMHIIYHHHHHHIYKILVVRPSVRNGKFLHFQEMDLRVLPTTTHYTMQECFTTVKPHV